MHEPNTDAYRVWHTWSPITRLARDYVDDLSIERAEGCTLYAKDGRQIFDAAAGLWTVNVGHGRPEIAKAVHDALTRMTYLHGGSTQLRDPQANALADRILSHAPEHYGRVMFHCTGTSAVESAHLAVRRFFKLSGEPQRHRTISLDQGYHGSSLFGFSLAGQDEYVEGSYGPRVPGCHHIPLPFGEDGETKSIEALKSLLKENDPKTFASFIFEPVLGSAGTYPLPKRWLEQVIAICHEHSIKVIVDEVITGLGRVGRWFASEDLDADIVVLGKGLGSGYFPVTATVHRESLFEPFLQGEGTPLETGCTMDCHPAASATGLAVLKIIEEERLVEHARAMGELMLHKLASLSDLPNVGTIRGRGLMAAIPVLNKEGGPASFAQIEQLHHALFRAGLLVIVSYDALNLSPPLTVTEAQLDQAVALLRKTLESA